MFKLKIGKYDTFETLETEKKTFQKRRNLALQTIYKLY